ncbi:toll/interleukin-1 receptor domain-containing protein [Cyanobacteria bacterium FACHB-471]|nr:toll/interleukin-1 receptor domain-containing protein [Cyanobacteria bacterium FACHB-471]
MTDVFISYAWSDNQVIDPDRTEGQWVTALYEYLKSYLWGDLGRQPNIFRDENKIRGYERLTPTIAEEVRRSQILLAVMSKGYVQSEWCQEEARVFLEKFKLESYRKLPICKVIKNLPEPRDQKPSEFQELLGYPFYEVKDGNRIREYRPEWQETKEQFLQRIKDVSEEIAELLESIDSSAVRQRPKALFPAEIAVYLAETTEDQQENRDKLRRELEQWGCTVLPQMPLPYNSRLTARVQDDLSHCVLSIHILGERYGAIPEAETLGRSVIQIQAELANARSEETTKFTRLIWLPPALNIETNQHSIEKAQIHLIEALQNSDEFIQTPLENFKEYIQDKLHSLIRVNEQRSIRRVYLIHHECDRLSVATLEDYLFDQDFEEVNTSLFDLEESNREKYHKTCLIDCDTVIVYCHSASLDWVTFMLKDIRKADEQGTKLKIVYFDGIEPKSGRVRTMKDVRVIYQTAECLPDELGSLLS